jgi:hypothetical protein
MPLLERFTENPAKWLTSNFGHANALSFEQSLDDLHLIVIFSNIRQTRRTFGPHRFADNQLLFVIDIQAYRLLIRTVPILTRKGLFEELPPLPVNATDSLFVEIELLAGLNRTLHFRSISLKLLLELLVPSARLNLVKSFHIIYIK